MRVISYIVLWFGVLCFCAHARTRKAPDAHEDRDSLQVIAHVPLKDSSSCRLTTAEHWRRQYVYLDHPKTDNLTIIDISKPSEPQITKEVNRGHIPGEVRLMVGDIALITSPITDTAPETVSNISGFAKAGGLIFIVNDEGLWILQQHPGSDIEFEKEYERRVLYDR